MKNVSGCATQPWPYPTRTGDPPPGVAWPLYPPTANPVPPSIMEQMGIDPISKLAAAIEKLAEAIKSQGGAP